MWDDFLARLRGTPKVQELPKPDEKLALGALLVRVAKSDSFYHVSEIVEIDHILAQSFGLNAVEAAKFRATSEKLESHAPDTTDFAALIRETVDYAHKAGNHRATLEGHLGRRPRPTRRTQRLARDRKPPWDQSRRQPCALGAKP